MTAARLRAAGRALTASGTVAAALLTVHTAVNVRLVRRPAAPSQPVRERVSILLPVRDEEGDVADCLTAILAQRRLADVEVLVLDDQSSDRTEERARAVLSGHPDARLLRGAPPPPGWLGKPYACHQLAQAARGDVLVFVDADVRMEPDAVAATVAQLRGLGLDLVCPYPRQLALSPAERLVQPLLQWSWLTTLPLRVAERSARPSLGAANGQLLAVDAAAYRRCGGHGSVRGDVLDDLALLRAVKAAGGRGTVTDGSAVATCRMYTGWRQLRDGYGKSLWTAFGSGPGAVAANAALLVTYVVPAAAALTGSRVGALGYLAGVAGRVLTARATGGRAWPDAAAHPVSVVVLAYLTARSLAVRRQGGARWKGRPVEAARTCP